MAAMFNLMTLGAEDMYVDPVNGKLVWNDGLVVKFEDMFHSSLKDGGDDPPQPEPGPGP